MLPTYILILTIWGNTYAAIETVEYSGSSACTMARDLWTNKVKRGTAICTKKVRK